MKKENMHFLFSALALIYEYTLIDETENSLEVTSRLTALSRYCLTESEDLIESFKEIEQIENFLYIEQLRFQSGFTYSIVSDDNFNFRLIERFAFLEPFIEYFYNYIEIQPQGKTIDLKFQLESKCALMKFSSGNSEARILQKCDF